MGLSADKAKHAVNVSVLAVLLTVVINPRLRYDSSPGWAWGEEQKRKELANSTAKFLYIVSSNNQLVAFVHFRFVLEDSLSTGKSAVLYWCSLFVLDIICQCLIKVVLAMNSRLTGAFEVLA